MKFSTVFSFALFIFPVAQEVSAGALVSRQRNGKGKGDNNKPPAAPDSTPTAAADPAAEKGFNADPQKSLVLDSRVIAQGFAQDGQNPPVAGQVASLTSTNNFINFCLTVPNLPITNGQQIKSGSCNPAPIGAIPSTDNMPSAKFVFPKNGQTVPANQGFKLQIAIKNLATGNFVNAQKNYFGAPQQLQGGVIKGHSHAVIEKLTALDQTTPTDPNTFVFFKGLNEAAQGGILIADVTNGIPAGAYRVCTINTSSNHQPAIVPIAQHGSLDDCSYFTATNGGAPVPPDPDAATTPPPPAKTGDGKNKGKGRGRN